MRTGTESIRQERLSTRILTVRWSFFSYSHRQSREDEYDSSYIRTPFSDIEDHWAYESIRFAINQGLMDGVRESLFAPDESTTQAMFLAVLARMEGVTVKNSGKTAVDDGTGADEPESGDAAPWYRDAVLWAEENGILKDWHRSFHRRMRSTGR